MGLLASQRAGIATLIGGVATAGVVKDYFPQPSGEWSKFVDAFRSTVGGTSHVRVWIVTYTGEERIRRTAGTMGAQGKVIRRTSWLIRGFLGWSTAQATEETFDDLVEAIANAIDLDRTLGSTADDHTAVGVRIPNDGAGVNLGDVLCHAAELRFTADKDVLIA